MLILCLSLLLGLGGGDTLIVSGTARTVCYGGTGPEKAFDGNVRTMYHSCNDANPEWLQLNLVKPMRVAFVKVVNR